LALAEELARHEDVARRAAAGVLAWHTQRKTPVRAFALLLTIAQDPLVAAERDIADLLYRIAVADDASAEQRAHAQALVLALIPISGYQARQGGRSAMILRAWGSITPIRMAECLHDMSEARRAAAVVIAGWLGDPLAPAWIREQAVVYANDPNADIGDTILHAFTTRTEHLLLQKDFMTLIVSSAAARRNPQDILELCSVSPKVLGVAKELLLIAANILEDRLATDDQWRHEAIVDACARAVQALASEAEQQGAYGVRNQALDVWDSFIEKGLAAPAQRLDHATDYGLGPG